MYVHLHTYRKYAAVFNMQGFLGRKNEMRVISFLNTAHLLRWIIIISYNRITQNDAFVPSSRVVEEKILFLQSFESNHSSFLAFLQSATS